MKWFILLMLTSAMTAGLLLKGGVWPAEWNWCAAAVALAGVFAWVLPMRERQARGDGWIVALACALAVWFLLQLVPLPGWIVGALSPKRLELARAAGESGWIALSAGPASTFEWGLAFLPAILAVLLGQHMGSMGLRWAAVAPLLGLASLEGMLGLVQFYLMRMSGGASDSATGTFVNRNHFAGFLEMGLPLALGGALWAWRSGKHGGRAAVKAMAFLSMAAVMMMAIVVSLSRMGFLAALSSLLIVGMLAITATEQRMFGGERSWRWAVPALLVLAATVCGFFYLPTDELIARFATLAQTDDINQDTRAEIWKQTWPLITAYPLTGSGLGTYESAFRQYKNVAPNNTVDFAHNDYLQALAEVGLIGVAIGFALLLRVLGRVLKVVLWHKEAEHWELSLGVAGAIIAMLLHSLVDFNMYIPTNALMIGWICGIGASLAVRTD